MYRDRRDSFSSNSTLASNSLELQNSRVPFMDKGLHPEALRLFNIVKSQMLFQNLDQKFCVDYIFLQQQELKMMIEKRMNASHSVASIRQSSELNTSVYDKCNFNKDQNKRKYGHIISTRANISNPNYKQVNFQQATYNRDPLKFNQWHNYINRQEIRKIKTQQKQALNLKRKKSDLVNKIESKYIQLQDLIAQSQHANVKCKQLEVQYSKQCLIQLGGGEKYEKLKEEQNKKNQKLMKINSQYKQYQLATNQLPQIIVQLQKQLKQLEIFQKSIEEQIQEQTTKQISLLHEKQEKSNQEKMKLKKYISSLEEQIKTQNQKIIIYEKKIQKLTSKNKKFDEKIKQKQQKMLLYQKDYIDNHKQWSGKCDQYKKKIQTLTFENAYLKKTEQKNKGHFGLNRGASKSNMKTK